MFIMGIVLPIIVCGQSASTLIVETGVVGTAFRQAEQTSTAYRLEATYMAALRDSSHSPCGGNGSNTGVTKSRPKTKVLQSELPHFELKDLPDGVYAIQVFYGQKTGEQTGTYLALPSKTVTINGKDQYYYLQQEQSPLQKVVGMLHIFPNPGNEQCTITFPTANAFEIKLIDVQGRILQQTTNAYERIAWDLSRFISGVYTIVAVDEVTGLQYQGKWIKVE